MSSFKKAFRFSWLGWPASLWFCLLLAGPLALIVITSFLKRGTYGGLEFAFTLQNYARAFQPIYLDILSHSFRLAFLNTVLCLGIGFPVAWVMATVSSRYRMFLVFLIAVPFLMNLIIRVYAIRLFSGYDGPVVEFLRWAEIPHDPFAFSQNQFLVIYAMVTCYLPFMIFPLYAALEKFDFQLLEANLDLGGSHWTALFKVLIPNNRRAIANGCLLVFVPSLGEFVIPDLLGGAKNMLAGNLISEQFLKARDWPFGSALGVLLILVLLSFSFVILHFGKAKE
jgi:spermidine/putrescine transport system permease protein